MRAETNVVDFLYFRSSANFNSHVQNRFFLIDFHDFELYDTIFYESPLHVIPVSVTMDEYHIYRLKDYQFDVTGLSSL